MEWEGCLGVVSTDPSADDIIRYGKLVEGVHLAAYSFERVLANLEHLLEGDRWRLGGRLSGAGQFLDSLQLSKFRLLAEQRKQIAKRIKELQPEVSNRDIAKAIGAGRSTINRDVGPNGPANDKKDNENNDSPGPNGSPSLSASVRRSWCGGTRLARWNRSAGGR